MKGVEGLTLKLYRAAALVLAVVCLALLWNEVFGQNGILTLRKQKREFQALEEQIQKLQQENLELEKQVKALKSDPKAIEKQAREQLRLARPGEFIYTLPEKDPQPPNANRSGKNTPPK